MGSPKICACLIVRDEGEHLGACLETLHGAADQVVVVDTGSRDDTVAVAQRAGAQVSHFAWVNDFAAARNFAASLARTPWILSIDADERLDHAGVQAIRQAVASAASTTLAFELRQVTYTDERSLLNWQPLEPWMNRFSRLRSGFIAMTMQRLYRNMDGIEFEGRVHELVGPSVLRLGGNIEGCSANLHHYGRLDGAALHAKLHTYVALGEEKLLDDPACVRTYLELGTQLGELGEPDRAIDVLERGLAACPDAPGLMLPLAGYLVGRGTQADARARALCRRRLELVPHCSASSVILGSVAMRRGEASTALEHYERALARTPRMHTARRGRVAALAVAGRLEEAREEVSQLLADDGSDAALHHLAGKIDVALGRDRAAVVELTQARRLGGEGVELHELFVVAYTRLGDPVRARAHLRRAERARAA